MMAVLRVEKNIILRFTLKTSHLHYPNSLLESGLNVCVEGEGVKKKQGVNHYVDVQVVLICVDDSVTIYVEVPVCSYDIPVSVRMYVSPPQTIGLMWPSET